MKTNIINVLLILIILFLSNCYKPTKPNQSVAYEIKSLNLISPANEKQNSKTVEIPKEIQDYLIHLYNLDAELAIELGRLPEFKHGASPTMIKALKRFVNLVENATEAEINNFKLLINEGNPEIRKFCTILQAVIWYLEKNEISDNSEFFKWDYRRILWESWGFCTDYHWKGKDFDEVTDRLNSPSLINYYVKKNFFYLSKNKNRNTAQNAISIFARKEGNCRGYADFQCVCLKKAGYDAEMILVKSVNLNPYHAVCEFKDKDGKIYIMDNTLYKSIITKDRYTEMYPQIYR